MKLQCADPYFLQSIIYYTSANTSWVGDVEIVFWLEYRRVDWGCSKTKFAHNQSCWTGKELRLKMLHLLPRFVNSQLYCKKMGRVDVFQWKKMKMKNKIVYLIIVYVVVRENWVVGVYNFKHGFKHCVNSATDTSENRFKIHNIF